MSQGLPQSACADNFDTKTQSEPLQLASQEQAASRSVRQGRGWRTTRPAVPEAADPAQPCQAAPAGPLPTCLAEVPCLAAGGRVRLGAQLSLMLSWSRNDLEMTCV